MQEKKIITIFAIFSFIILNTLICFNIYKTKFISKDIVRLHVVANSNSLTDQITKLKVESKIKEYLSNLQYNDKSSCINEIKENSSKILDIASCTVKDNSKEYGATLKIGKISYNEKKSVTLNMKKGTYDSACIVLGEGNGKNIWSIIFPNEKTIDKLKELDTILPGISNIYDTDDTQLNLPEDENKIEIKSKILELLNIKI